jgi:hypothetical protein
MGNDQESKKEIWLPTVKDFELKDITNEYEK